ncbi:MAG: OmpA family protein [Treponemataceae bacterium]|nr:OmpA family protein [Treponemataceae bacterium]
MKRIKRVLLGTTLALCVAGSAVAASNRPLYISPNNDGIQDELTIPLTISDKRYVSEWSLVISDDEGNVVRTIGNKEKRPEKMTFKLFLKQLFAKKEGVPVPSEVIWNGVLDSGETAADGTYHYYITAVDDNGNRGQTKTYDITVDNTEPTVEIAKVPESAKIFGAGNKTTIVFNQTGSVEDLWVATITDVNGNVVRTWKSTNSEPPRIEWDGKNDAGVAVEEGVYTYRIAATDRAGNVNDVAQVTNIIYDAVPRSINLSVKDSPFSPNGDGIRDLLLISPYMSNASGLLDWDITAIARNGDAVRTWKGTTTSPADFEYDGTADGGNLLSDGDYQLKFRARYNNGQEAVITRNFTVDVTAPVAVVRFDNAVFSPDGDGNKDTITFSQETSKEKSWKAEILDANGTVVKTFDFGELPPAKVEWDGMTDAGTIVEGNFTYRLAATDLAGNTGYGETLSFELNTGVTEVLLTMSDKAFSPNGDKVKDTITFTPQVKTTSAVTSYEFTVLDTAGTTVYTSKAAKALPKNFTWNGTLTEGGRAPDGQYTAKLFTVSANGAENTVATPAFTLDTVVPEVSVSVPYLTMSPNGDSRKDTLPLTITTSAETRWNVEITGKDKTVYRSWNFEGTVNSFAWDGCDEAGNTVPDGQYTFTIGTADEAGNSVKESIAGITVDTRSVKAYLTAELDGFSPNGDGYLETQTFSIMAVPEDGIASWNFTVAAADGSAVQTWSSETVKNLPKEIIWNGGYEDGRAAEGTFTGVLNIEYEKGDAVSVATTPFLCSVTAPQLTVQTAPSYFSPDNDGVDDDLFIRLTGKDVASFTAWSFEIKDPKGNSFWKTSGKNTITERIIWDGRSNSGELVQSATDYPYVFTVTDELGMTSTVEGVISVDVLVIRVGDVLKMQIPSIIFRSDNADFKSKNEVKNGLEPAQIENNERVLKRVAEILNKFKDYNVTIEGHANSMSGTMLEETTDTAQYGKALQPLSAERAAYVKTRLVEYGVDGNRLQTVGKGGSEPVAAREDKDNNWKNRRVEFILNK